MNDTEGDSLACTSSCETGLLFLCGHPSHMKVLPFADITTKAAPSFSVILTLSPPESNMKTCSVVLTFESVDEILWCDHSNETSSAVFFYGIIGFAILQNGIFL